MHTLSRLFALPRRELVAFLALFVVSLPAVTPRLYSSDEIEYFSYLRSLWFDHDVSFENEYRHFYDLGVARAEGFRETFLELETEAGRRPNFGTIGCAVLWAPFYAAGDLSARLLRAAGRPVAADGFSQPYIAAVAYGSAIYGFLAVLLSVGFARRVIGARAAGGPALAGLAVWIGTPLVFYMYIAPPMSHACSAFAVALFLRIWLHARDTWTPGRGAALGLSAALMAMTREQDVFFAAGPAVDFLMTWSMPGREGGRRPSTMLRAGIAGCLAAAIGFLPQALAYWRLNGHPSPSRLVLRKMSWTAPHAWDVLFSPAHGFVAWTPMVVLAVIGLVLLAAQPGEVRRVSVLALLMVALQIYIGGSVESWTVAGAFGQRRFVALTAILVLGLAGLWTEATRSRRTVIAVLAVLCVWWNLALIALFGTGLMNRQRLELARNAHDVFVTIPRDAPGLAWRYLTNRESYYRRPPSPQAP